MPNIRTGQNLKCPFCDTVFYRDAAYIRRNTGHKTCGNKECMTAARSGANNAFWGKTHSPELMAKVQATKRAKPGPRKRTGPPKGYKHTAEARAAMAQASKTRWVERRDFMMASRARGDDHWWKQINHVARHRKNFTRTQRKEWTGTQCVWCEATEDLVLDHIFPVSAGGERRKANAQTLCRPCNLWKMCCVDKPLYLAMLDHQGDLVNKS